MDQGLALQNFAGLLAAGAGDAEIESLLSALEEEHSLEKALTLLRGKHPGRKALIRILESASTRSRRSRQEKWQFDTERLILRITYEQLGPAAAVPPGQFPRILLELLEKAGLSVALSLEKRPRPLLQLGHLLPLGVEGRAESLDAVLLRPPQQEDLCAALNAVAPEGLRILVLELLPPHATPVPQLALASAWAWHCPGDLRAVAQERVADFLASDSWVIQKSGKLEGQKTRKEVEIRNLVLDMSWDGEVLTFRTRILPGQALHPAKLLGGILGVEPAGIRGLVRLRVELGPDPRAGMEDRFHPKLKNMFEDAVLLRAEGHLRIVDEDDEEPLQLG